MGVYETDVSTPVRTIMSEAFRPIGVNERTANERRERDILISSDISYTRDSLGYSRQYPRHGAELRLWHGESWDNTRYVWVNERSE